MSGRGQLLGVVAGAAVVMPAFNILSPDPAMLGTEAWPAPSCLVCAGVSEAFAHGIGALDPAAKSGILIAMFAGGLIAGVLAK